MYANRPKRTRSMIAITDQADIAAAIAAKCMGVDSGETPQVTKLIKPRKKHGGEPGAE